MVGSGSGLRGRVGEVLFDWHVPCSRLLDEAFWCDWMVRLTFYQVMSYDFNDGCCIGRIWMFTCSVCA